MTTRPNILFVTTDQQRFDSLGCNGNAACRTPAIDSLAAAGIRYTRAHTQNVLCTPSRVTMVTGQHPGTHGVWCNGVAMPRDAPSVAELLSEAGYATALLGKMHFEPGLAMVDHLRSIGAPADWSGPERGFDRIENGGHFPVYGHYGRWVREQLGPEAHDAHVEEVQTAFKGFGGDTGAPQALYSSLDPALSFSSWVVDRTLAWLDDLPPDTPFLAWTSFDDPHHPFKPPAAYGRRHDWRDIELPAARGRTREEIAADLDAKPWQYGAYWRGDYVDHEGSLGDRPGDLSDDQLRELIALTYGMIELIDDQLGRLLGELDRRGLLDNTHVVFTTDHGELLGDHGLLLKGPFHLDALLRLPLIWRPAGGRAPAEVHDPVGLVDLAPTFCSIAGLPVPAWMDGDVLPDADGSRERVISVFDSSYTPSLQLRTLYRDGWQVTAYPAIDDDAGELYDMGDDPLQLVNRWHDPAARAMRDDLLDDLRTHLIEDRRAERLRWWVHA